MPSSEYLLASISGFKYSPYDAWWLLAAGIGYKQPSTCAIANKDEVMSPPPAAAFWLIGNPKKRSQYSGPHVFVNRNEL